MQPRGPPPVDIQGFRQTMREAGIEEIVEATLAVFVEEARVVFADLSAAVLAREAEAIRSHAHSLKSSSGNIRAARLAELLNELELAARGGDLPAATDIFDHVRPEYQSVLAYLAESVAND